MKPHPRIRKAVKWGGMAVSVVLMVVWVGSDDIEAGYVTARGNGAVLDGGRLILRYEYLSEYPPSVGLRLIAHTHPRFYWWFSGREELPGWWIAIPLWFPLTLTLMATAAAWRLDVLARARARVGLCPKCHYDLRGLAPGAKCPECGGDEGK